MKKWNYLFDVPDQKKIRVIISTDCKNEADDQFALAHQLMTPKFIVKGIVASHFALNPQTYGRGNTASASLEEIYKILELMGQKGTCPAEKGSEYPLKDERTPATSEGARLIIQEAMREDPHPLYIICQGALTDLASAILIQPQICRKMTAIWVGGGTYPEGGFEFNCKADIAAANVVMRSDMQVWQIPINVYKQVSVSLAELQLHVAPCGEIGKYLFEQMCEFNNKCAGVAHWPHGEIWGLGDSAAIGVLMEEVEKTDIYDMQPAPEIGYDDMKYSFEKSQKDIRVYNSVNARLILSDLFAKLQINFGNQQK